jgi:hypothetical protein
VETSGTQDTEGRQSTTDIIYIFVLTVHQDNLSKVGFVVVEHVIKGNHMIKM